MSVPSAGADPQDQPARTSLAWSRALTGLAAVSVILLRWLDRAGWLVLPLLALSLGAVVAVALSQRRRLLRLRRGQRAGVIPADVVGCLLLACAVILLGVGGAAVILLAPG